MNAVTEVLHRLSEQEVKLLAQLRHQRAEKVKPDFTLGERIADSVAATMGSWNFIIIQSNTGTPTPSSCSTSPSPSRRPTRRRSS